jgi:hypothetical protein
MAAVTAGLEEAAYNASVRTVMQEIVEVLQEVLGRKPVAIMAGVSDVKTVTRWAQGQQTPRLEAEQRLRVAFQVFQLLAQGDSPHTIRAWFLGMNPQLGDWSPIRAISAGRFTAVKTAAKSFLQGG